MTCRCPRPPGPHDLMFDVDPKDDRLSEEMYIELRERFDEVCHKLPPGKYIARVILLTETDVGAEIRNIGGSEPVMQMNAHSAEQYVRNNLRREAKRLDTLAAFEPDDTDPAVLGESINGISMRLAILALKISAANATASGDYNAVSRMVSRIKDIREMLRKMGEE